MQTVNVVSVNHEVITAENFDTLVTRRRAKDYKTFTQMVCAASILCCWWPVSCICLIIALYATEKVGCIRVLGITCIYMFPTAIQCIYICLSR